MDWTQLNSSLIQSASHDPQTGDLSIQFHNGRRYLYPAVPTALADKLFSADSPGRFFHKFIRPNFQGDEITDQ